MNLLSRVKITAHLEDVASATGTSSGTVIDMAGWDGVLFVANANATDTRHHLRAEGGGASSAVNEQLKNTAIENLNKSLALDIYRPRKRFIRAVFRASDTATTRSVIAIQYKSGALPFSHTATATGATYGRVVVSPDTGTASDTA